MTRRNIRHHVRLLPLALLSGLPLLAQAPATPKEALQCEALRHKGDPASRDCYQRLTRSSDSAVAAEGFWALTISAPPTIPSAPPSSFTIAILRRVSVGDACTWITGRLPKPATCSGKP